MLGQTGDELLDAPQKRRAGVLGHSPDVLEAPPSEGLGTLALRLPASRGSHTFAVELLPQPASRWWDLGGWHPAFILSSL